MKHTTESGLKTAYRFLAVLTALAIAAGLFSYTCGTVYATEDDETESTGDDEAESGDDDDTPDESDVEAIEQEIEEQEAEIEETEQDIEETEGTISSLEAAKAAMEEYLEELNAQYSSLADEIAALNEEIEAKQAEIDETEAALAEAVSVQEQQYEDMKTRIQYMYENPQSSFLEILLTGGSFADALNQYAYAASITEYDREMFEAYVAQMEEIEEQEAILEAEMEALDELYAEVAEKQSEVSSLQSSTSGQISQHISDIADATAMLSDQESTLETQQEVLEELIAEKKQIEAALEAAKAAEILESIGTEAVGVRTTTLDYVTYSAYSATEEEITALAVLIYCEAGNQGYEGQLAVGSVVMNRIRDSRFSQTDIISVIRASGQFSPVTSGRFDLMLESGLDQVTDSCYQAAEAAIGGTSNVGNRVFFRTYAGYPELSGLVIGDHIFSYTWNYVDDVSSSSDTSDDDDTDSEEEDSGIEEEDEEEETGEDSGEEDEADDGAEETEE